MNVGLVVEGPSDRAVYRTLVRRIRADIGELQVRDCGGKSKLKSAFVGFLKEFDRNSAWDIDVALVIRDSDCKPSEHVEARMRENFNPAGFGFGVDFFATKCQLETWLLTDENAINQISQRKGKNRRVERIQIQFETDNNAKKHFQQQLSRAALLATTETYAEIADVLDLETAIARCANFQRFVNTIRGYQERVR